MLPTKARSLKAVLLLSSSMTVMAGAMIAPALTDIAAYFPDYSPEWIKLVLAMPALMIGLFAGLIGRLSDRLGRINLLLTCLIIYAVAGVAGFFLKNLIWLLVSRAGLGLGVAGIMSLSTTLIGDYFTGEERQRFMGVQAAVMALGGMVFLLVGGFLAENSWRYPFLLYGLAIIVFPVVWRVLYEPPKEESNRSTLVGAEGKKADYFLIRLIYVVGFLGMVFFYMLPTQLPFLLEEKLGITGSWIGMALAVVTLTAAISSASYSRIKRRLSYQGVFAVGFGFMALGFFLVSVLESYQGIIISLAVAGLGAGCFLPNCNLWLAELSPVDRRGQLVGTLSSMFFFGQFFSPLIVGMALVGSSIPLAFRGASIILLGLSFVLGFLIRSSKNR